MIVRINLTPISGCMHAMFVGTRPDDQRPNASQRLHGAFTGGFSAGFFNTVGSEEGWEPSFAPGTVSRRRTGQQGERNRVFDQSVDDFMDDEDRSSIVRRNVGRLGNALNESLSSDREGIGHSDTFKRRRRRFGLVDVNGIAQREPFLGPETTPDARRTLLGIARDEDDTFGAQMLRRMGFRRSIRLSLDPGAVGANELIRPPLTPTAYLAQVKRHAGAERGADKVDAAVSIASALEDERRTSEAASIDVDGAAAPAKTSDGAAVPGFRRPPAKRRRTAMSDLVALAASGTSPVSSSTANATDSLSTDTTGESVSVADADLVRLLAGLCAPSDSRFGLGYVGSIPASEFRMHCGRSSNSRGAAITTSWIEADSDDEAESLHFRDERRETFDESLPVVDDKRLMSAIDFQSDVIGDSAPGIPAGFVLRDRDRAVQRTFFDEEIRVPADWNETCLAQIFDSATPTQTRPATPTQTRPATQVDSAAAAADALLESIACELSTSVRPSAKPFANMSEQIQARFVASTAPTDRRIDPIVSSGLQQASASSGSEQKISQQSSCSQPTTEGRDTLGQSHRTVQPWMPDRLVCKRLNIRVPALNRGTGAEATTPNDRLATTKALLADYMPQTTAAGSAASHDDNASTLLSQLLTDESRLNGDTPVTQRPSLEVFRSIFG